MKIREMIELESDTRVRRALQHGRDGVLALQRQYQKEKAMLDKKLDLINALLKEQNRSESDE